MKRAIALLLLISAALLAPHGTVRAQSAPEYVDCITATSTQCNTSSNPGNGTQGDTAWFAFGKFNLDITALQPPTPQYSLVYANGASYGGALPGSSGTWCLQWTSLSAAPTLVACPGSGSTAFNTLTSGTNASATMIVDSGASITPIDSGIINANEIDGAAAGTFATQNYATPPAIGGTTPAAGHFTTLSASSTVSGAGFSAYLAAPPAIGGTTPAAGSFSALTDTGITGSTQCLHASTAGLVSGTGSDCGTGGSAAFSAITNGSNTTAAMLVGTGASLGYTGSGTISATSVGGMTAPSSSGVLGYLACGAHAQETTGYTTVLADNATCIPISCASACTMTLPANSSVAYPVGAIIVFTNRCGAAGTVTLTVTTDTSYLMPTAATGSRTLAPCGQATAQKTATTEWTWSGTNLT